MAILSVSNRKGYLSFLVDEISKIERDSLIFICRDKEILIVLRDCLDSLHISNSVIEDLILRPAVSVDKLDAVAKIYFSCGEFLNMELFKNILIKEGVSLTEREVSDDLDLGWISALFDLKAKVYTLPRPRLLIRSANGKVFNKARLILDHFSIEYRVFKRPSYKSISIGKRDEIRKVLSLIPLNIRLNEEVSRLVLSFDNKLNSTD